MLPEALKKESIAKLKMYESSSYACRNYGAGTWIKE